MQQEIKKQQRLFREDSRVVLDNCGRLTPAWQIPGTLEFQRDKQYSFDYDQAKDINPATGLNLQFGISADGEFVVTERTVLLLKVVTTIVIYSSDLTYKQINSRPWQPVTRTDREWFTRQYAPIFAERFGVSPDEEPAACRRCNRASGCATCKELGGHTV